MTDLQPTRIKAPTFETIEVWFYRAGVFLLMNVLDEPAYLALMFC